MDLTELVMDDEMADDDCGGGDSRGDGRGDRRGGDTVEDDFLFSGKKVHDPAQFLNESFADSEDLDDEMDGEEEEETEGEGEGDGENSSNGTSSSNSSKYSCSVCGKSGFISKRSLRQQHVRCEHLDTCYWSCQSCGGVFPDLELFKVSDMGNICVKNVSFLLVPSLPFRRLCRSIW